MKTFGEILKKLRLESGLTQDDLAEELNKKYNIRLNKGMISKWESNKSEARLEYARVLARFFNVTLDYFLGEEDECNNSFISLNEKNLLSKFNELNDLGKREALKRVDELTYINKYTNIDLKQTDDLSYLNPIAAHDDDLTDEEKNRMDEIIAKKLEKLR